jgi:hypothetical protein
LKINNLIITNIGRVMTAYSQLIIDLLIKT